MSNGREALLDWIEGFGYRQRLVAPARAAMRVPGDGDRRGNAGWVLREQNAE